MTSVWIVYKSTMMKDDLLSIWSTEKLAEAAVHFYEERRREMAGNELHPPLYLVKEWKVNTTVVQWD